MRVAPLRDPFFPCNETTPNESATLPFVIPSAAEGSAVLPWENHGDPLNHRWVAQVSLLRPGFCGVTAIVTLGSCPESHTVFGY